MTTEQFSALIGCIYDCALDPQLWPATIETITGSVGATIGFIVLHDYGAQQGRRLFDHGVTDHWRQRWVMVAMQPAPCTEGKWATPPTELPQPSMGTLRLG